MHVLDLVLGMRDEFEIHVGTGEEGFLTEACRDNGIPVHVVPSLEREIKPLPDVKALYALRSLMRTVEPDLVHAHTFKAGFLGRFVAKRLRIPAIFTVHMWQFGRAVPLSWRVVAPVCERSSRLAVKNKWCQFSMASQTTRHGRAWTVTKD